MPDKQWLIRKSETQLRPDALDSEQVIAGFFSLIGPLERDEILSKIKTGELQADDEVCEQGGYWFFLFEEVETKNFLGIAALKQNVRHNISTSDYI